jgi:5,6-dimethylbenzimidazole synthase
MVKNGISEFSDAEREAVYRAIRTRRDVRRGFLARPVPDALLQKLLAAAHSAPSVGLMQPSRFIVVRSPSVRREVYDIFERANAHAAASYNGEQRDQYVALKLEGILEASVNLCIVCDPNSAGTNSAGTRCLRQLCTRRFALSKTCG